ncbi:RNA 2',3'-cyclic phosphodiesterase [bacterium]|nr:RNA 2',3'-cyclic phosphodiesterase [bacterium]
MIQENGEVIRSFVAIPLSKSIQEAIGDLSSRFRELMKDARTRVAWVKPESIHLTLKFLGSLEAARVDSVMKGLKDAVSGFNAFSLAIGGAGIFPNQNQPRVIWLGVQKGEEDVCRLQKSVENALNILGFEVEKREFSPHLTLGRIKILGSRGEVLRSLRELQGSQIGEMEAGQVCLMKSELTPKGSIYTELGSVGLKKVH